MDRLAAACAAIDAANAEDPVTVVVDGRERPKELVHAERMTHWVTTLDPAADDAQLLAARAHHLRRWAIPRDAYPEGRSGYLRWRKALKDRHAVEVGAILVEVGYDTATIERVQAIVRKVGLGSVPAVQTHEDALCLVFVELQYEDLLDRLGDPKMVDVVAKTLAKMSAQGITLAASLPMSDRGREVLAAAAARGDR